MRDRCPGDCPPFVAMDVSTVGELILQQPGGRPVPMVPIGPALRRQVFTHRRWSDGTHDWLPEGSTVDTPVST
jgi:hypothetical protein